MEDMRHLLRRIQVDRVLENTCVLCQQPRPQERRPLEKIQHYIGIESIKKQAFWKPFFQVRQFSGISWTPEKSGLSRGKIDSEHALDGFHIQNLLRVGSTNSAFAPNWWNTQDIIES